MTENLIRILGEIDGDIDFTYGPYEWRNGDTTHVAGSCAATLNNEMYVFGGQFVERQVNFSIRAYRANPLDPYLEHFGDVVERHLLTKNPQSYFYF